jgi:hypothetical protein
VNNQLAINIIPPIENHCIPYLLTLGSNEVNTDSNSVQSCFSDYIEEHNDPLISEVKSSSKDLMSSIVSCSINN